MQLSLSLALVAPFLIAVVGCSRSTAGPLRPMADAPPAAAPAAPAPPPADDAIALRAEGPAALDRLLVRYAALSSDGARAALAATIDQVAAQRYASVSGLYWYTDLAAAQAAARAEAKPILALRMLGHLDEELSCANSRMFRTILYPDRAVARLLRERFVLYWSSERPVPRVTVDYGDGRTLATTVTGNSAHYVLDADGRPLDVLPGMYAPAVFAAELARIADQAARVRELDDAAWRAAMLRYHQGAAKRAAQQWAGARRLPTVGGKLATPAQLEVAAARAQRATISKAYVEVPIIGHLDLGVDPGALPADDDVRTAVATQLWQLTPEAVLDPAARALIESLLPAGDHAAVLARLTRGILAETVLDDLSLRPQIRARLLDDLELGATPAFAALNRFVYAEVFHAPADDPWMGLLSTTTYTGLPGGAIVSRR
ncbi:MAG: hypothetical protein JNK64_18090 [Myxococcales bacterium]|nr:hypothetical protein [Myxococcales bacterium]